MLNFDDMPIYQLLSRNMAVPDTVNTICRQSKHSTKSDRLASSNIISMRRQQGHNCHYLGCVKCAEGHAEQGSVSFFLASLAGSAPPHPFWPQRRSDLRCCVPRARPCSQRICRGKHAVPFAQHRQVQHQAIYLQVLSCIWLSSLLSSYSIVSLWRQWHMIVPMRT